MQKIIQFTVVCLVMMGHTLYSQSNIQLLSQNDQKPIVGAYFSYGAQEGTSDENGYISISETNNEILYLTHVSFGSMQVDARQLAEIIQDGKLQVSGTSIQLFPVTVLSVRPGKQPFQNITLKLWDKLAHDGANLLNQTTGITNIRKSGNYGLDPVFRGFKYDQLNIVINGAQSATAACPNRMDPPTSQIAPNMMDRVEILKGPYSLRYGAGLGGTINFIPTDLWFSEQSNVYGRSSVSYESNGNVIRNESQIGFNGRKYDISVFGAWSQGDDYTAGDGSTVGADFSRGSFGSNFGLKINDRQQLRASVTYNKARDTDFPALAMDLREDDTWMLNARHDISFANRSLQSVNTTAYASLVDHKMDNLLKQLDPRMVNAETLAKTMNYGGRSEGKWRFMNSTLHAGLDYRMEGASGERTREMLMGPMAGRVLEDNVWQDGQIEKAGLFAEYIHEVGATSLIISGRTEWNHSNILDADEGFLSLTNTSETTQINPSVSIGASRTLNDRSKIGLWAGRVQRSAGLTERFINFFPVGQDPYELVGNPELAPEVNNQVDLTYSWTGLNSSINFDVFGSMMTDYISSRIDRSLNPVIPSSPGVRSFINIDQAFKYGFEANWRQGLTEFMHQQIGIAYTYAQDLELEEPLPEIPPLDLSYLLTANFLDKKLQTAVKGRFVSEQQRISSEFGETITPSFFLLDVYTTYQFSKNLKAIAGINNLLDENYYEHLSRSVVGTNGSIYDRGRNLFVSVNYTF
jgi:iron complex outermembrane receptor protein